jgi:GAF domain-containing protein
MMDQDLRDRVEGLFSGAGLEPEEEKSEPVLEEAIVGLLGDEAGLELETIERMAVDASRGLPVRPEEAREEDETPPADARLEEVPLRERTRILSVLLHSVTTLGGVLLVFLLIRLVWQESMPWSGLHTLYLAAYTVAIVITLIQWMLNAFLSRALRKAEQGRDEAVHTQALLRERADELAAANAALQKRVLQLEAAAQIRQVIAATLDLDELMRRAVNLVRERFDLHQVGLFLIDESGEWAVPQAGTGEANAQILTQNHRIEVGDTSPVSWCVANGQARIAPAVDATSRQGLVEIDALLPEPRWDMALPLKSRDQVIGALDVQSAERETFSQEDITVLQTVADQIAAAIDNARAFAEIQARLEDVEARSERQERERGIYPRPARAVPSYERTRPDVARLDEATMPEGAGALDQAIEAAMAQRQVVVQSGGRDGTEQAALVVPISLRGEALGTLGLHETEGKRQWTDDEIALIEAVADQMALAIENARLLEDTQQRAEQEQLVGQITAKMQLASNMDILMQNAIRELLAALDASYVAVHLGTEVELLTRLSRNSEGQDQSIAEVGQENPRKNRKENE